MRTASSSFDIYVKYKRRVITRKASTAPSTGNLLKPFSSLVSFLIQVVKKSIIKE